MLPVAICMGTPKVSLDFVARMGIANDAPGRTSQTNFNNSLLARSPLIVTTPGNEVTHLGALLDAKRINLEAGMNLITL